MIRKYGIAPDQSAAALMRQDDGIRELKAIIFGFNSMHIQREDDSQERIRAAMHEIRLFSDREFNDLPLG
jgi:hypothetical protein